ncbi:MAG: pyroglutamyl-peptidase I [Planctomycetaceae bacterium]
MTRILLTAFEPYDRWSENSSWLALVELTSWLEPRSQVVTRRYPVDLQAASDRLRKDLLDRYDYAIHLGQSPGSAVLRIETTGLNLRTDGTPLIEGAPAAYITPIAVHPMRDQLLANRIPAEVSHHAGTYLCNAVMYLSQHFSAQLSLPTRSVFLHLPLAPGQVAASASTMPSAGTAMMAKALSLVIHALEGSTTLSS